MPERNYEHHMFDPAQLRAARALLGWSQEELAQRADVALMMIKNFERSLSDPRLSSMRKLRDAIEEAGVRFVDSSSAHGAGVAWSASKTDGTGQGTSNDEED